MEQKNIETPDMHNFEDINDNEQSDNKQSIIFKRVDITGEYIEILKDMQNFELIIRNSGMLNLIISDYDNVNQKQLEQFKEITFIFDYTSFSEELYLENLDKFITNMNNKIDKTKTKINLIIKNCYINTEGDMHQVSKDNNLILNKLEIYDELYMLSTCLQEVFPNIKVTELILRRFKFNSKSQLSRFCEFIRGVECTKLTLDDIFIELIIKKSEDDDEYKDLDIYFSYLDGIITLENVYTNITSLTLKDAPLFAMIGKTFKKVDDPEGFKFSPKDIDIDETSLINPSIITKFKMENGKCDICFDLDAFKIRLEEDNDKNYDYLYYLNYIFNIIAPNLSKNNKEYIIKDFEDSGVNDISINSLHKLVFKNFDITKYEYITGDDVTYIDEKNWVLNEEEMQRKKNFENFEDLLLNRINKRTLPEVRELVFDNCSNYFIEWVLKIIKGRGVIHGPEYDFDLLKIKKCGNGYVDISRILKWKIKKLILFDTPLIIGEKFPENSEKHLNSIRTSLGTVDCLTIKINSLDCYGKEYNLNIMKTYEILIELIECEKFNTNIIFEMNALSSIMTYLAYIKYVKDQKLYNDPNSEEDGKDDISENQPRGQGLQILFEEDVKYLPKYIFLSSKKFRDYLCSQSFKLNLNLAGPITIKNTTIKKCYENYENNNYIIYKIQDEKYKGKQKPEGKAYTTNKELRKMDFGSDGFYIERDYKLFFFENQIKVVKLENVAFSNFRDNNIEGKYNRDFETINNLIGKNKYGDSIKKYEENKMKFPNYVMDMKTFNNIFCVNYGYENVTEFFKHYIYKTSKEEGKDAMYADIRNIKKTFRNFKNNIKELDIIINNIKEQKEFYCLAVLLDFLQNDQFINDPNSIKSIPEKSFLEKKLINYFTREKNENDDKVYSDFNYYNFSEGEEKMLKEKSIQISNYKINIEIRFDSFEEYI